ncbi:YSIRK-type signal peptide-containing protein [Aerococcus sanguinicola]
MKKIKYSIRKLSVGTALLLFVLL